MDIVRDNCGINGEFMSPAVTQYFDFPTPESISSRPEYLARLAEGWEFSLSVVMNPPPPTPADFLAAAPASEVMFTVSKTERQLKRHRRAVRQSRRRPGGKRCRKSRRANKTPQKRWKLGDCDVSVSEPQTLADGSQEATLTITRKY